MPRATLLVPIALGAALIASASQAQTVQSFAVQTPAITQRSLDLASPRAAFPLRYSRAAPPLPPGVARTSVEAGTDSVTGSAGLLCGLQPSADTSGAAMARGYDPDGKFVGAKLALRF
ncbi:MAG: hypothetical protein H7236_13475 [Gemmatimonadaceae bacterium]|nr:hypothetical protein [Caulobacter sp.]